MYCVKRLAVYIVVLSQLIESGEQFVRIHKRANNNQTAQHVPQPEIRRAEAVGNVAALQLVANAVRQLVVP